MYIPPSVIHPIAMSKRVKSVNRRNLWNIEDILVFESLWGVNNDKNLYLFTFGPQTSFCVYWIQWESDLYNKLVFLTFVTDCFFKCAHNVGISPGVIFKEILYDAIWYSGTPQEKTDSSKSYLENLTILSL